MQVSETFDPFMSILVPILKNLRHLPVKDPNEMPIQV